MQINNTIIVILCQIVQGKLFTAGILIVKAGYTGVLKMNEVKFMVSRGGQRVIFRAPWYF